jgi:site-specific recombinase XerD
LAAVRSFFTVLHENTIIAGNPAETVQRAKKEEKEPAVLFRNEYKALLFEARGDVRDFAILVTFLETGIRVGELVSLRVNDVDLENRTMTVRQGKGKKDRSIPLTEQTVKALQEYLTIRATWDIIDQDILFIAKNGTSMDVRTVRHLVHKYVTDAGIKKQASVHTLRHTYGSHKVANGMSIPALQELMGHKRKETTFKYVHLANSNLRAEQEKSALL